MTLWYKKSVIFILAGISYIVGQYLRGVWFNPSWPFPCQEIHSGSVIYCNAPYLAQGFALITLGETLAIVALILLFANARAFHKWLKFSYWYVPLATLLTFWMYPTTTLLGGVVPITQGVRLFGEPYIVITAYVVITDIISLVKQRLSEREKLS